MAARYRQVTEIEHHLIQVSEIAWSRSIEYIGGAQGCDALAKDVIDYGRVRHVILLEIPGVVRGTDGADIDWPSSGHDPIDVARI